MGAGVRGIGWDVLEGKVGVVIVGLEDGSDKAAGIEFGIIGGGAVKAGPGVTVVAGKVVRLCGVDAGKENVGDDGGGVTVQRGNVGEGGQGKERNNNFEFHV